MQDGSSLHSLVGRFFTNSTPPSPTETEQTLRQQWVPSGHMSVHKHDDGVTFSFIFTQKIDKEKILKKGPYNVNGVHIVLKDLTSSDKIDFTCVSFLVIVVGLPYYFCNNNFLPTLKSQVGDNNTLLHKTSNHYIFQVDVDLKKPLRPGFYIDQNQNRFVEFKYFNLGDFCYTCGMIGHVEENCDQVPLERNLNPTSRTHVYGPWLRRSPLETSCRIYLMRLPNEVSECDKSLTYPQFFIEVDLKILAVCDSTTESATRPINRFRFPCSYLYTETEDGDSITTSKAYEVIEREIYEKIPLSLGYLKRMPFNIPDVTESLVEEFKLIKDCDEHKWLRCKVLVTLQYSLTHVDHETFIAGLRERFIERKVTSLIKKRVEEDENLLSLSSWEDQIREVVSEMGFAHYLHHSYVSRRASKAMVEAVEIEISSGGCTVPADGATVCGLERFKVLGTDMDRLDPCVICSEEMFLAEEATVMPCCSRVFHRSCIEKWFQVGHKCPLCGFMLPSQKINNYH